MANFVDVYADVSHSIVWKNDLDRARVAVNREIEGLVFSQVLEILPVDAIFTYGSWIERQHDAGFTAFFESDVLDVEIDLRSSLEVFGKIKVVLLGRKLGEVDQTCEIVVP